MHEQVDALARRVAADEFWLEGWLACRRILRFEQKKAEGHADDRIVSLESALRPAGLEQQILAVLQATDWSMDLELGSVSPTATSAYERRAEAAKELGAAVANDTALVDRLIAVMHQGGVWAYPLGQGLAQGSVNAEDLWRCLLAGFKLLPATELDPSVLKGFLSELDKGDRALASKLLDLAWQDTSLAESLVELQLGVSLDAQALNRLHAAWAAGTVSAIQLTSIGHASKSVDPQALRAFLIAIATDQPGTHVALKILSMRVWSTQPDHELLHPALLDAARHLLSRVRLDRSQFTFNSGYELSDLIRRTLQGADGEVAAQQFARQLVSDLFANRVCAFDHTDLIRALLEVHPIAVLDAWFDTAGLDSNEAARLLQRDTHLNGPPTDVVSADKVLQWCNKRPTERFQLAASFVPFCAPSESAHDRPRWSTQAKQLLIHAPDKNAVLERLADQFFPSSWSGSRATIIERNATLLDLVGQIVPAELTPGLAALRQRLAKEIEEEHAFESRRQRGRDERFEW
jgi:hypothetical protein